MSEFLRETLTEILACVIGALVLYLQRWKAKRDFEIAKGQNEALKRIEAQTIGAVPPPVPPTLPRRAKRGSVLLPRAPTPLPFWPVKADDDDKEES